ncbi:MAG: ornithine cyclodeaminase family protein [Myxococcota bacterium]
METLILTQREIRALMTMDRVLPAVEAAFAAHGAGTASMPPKVYIDLPQYNGDFRAMPAFMDGAAGVKWVNSHPDNPARHGLPSVMGVYILSDPGTAAPLAILDATWLTALRTGAAAGVASKHLAKAAPKTLGFIGCGVQSRVLLDAHRVVYGDALTLMMADASADAAKAFAEEAGGTVASVEQAAGCDIVCTSTPVRTPIVRRAWIQPGAHINAMGADAEGKQELDSDVLTAARVVVDDRAQAFHSGEVNVPLHTGALHEAQVYGTLGEVVAGRIPGRSGDEITLFDSTGLALQDVAVAKAIYTLAQERGVGTAIALI